MDDKLLDEDEKEKELHQVCASLSFVKIMIKYLFYLDLNFEKQIQELPIYLPDTVVLEKVEENHIHNYARLSRY